MSFVILFIVALAIIVFVVIVSNRRGPTCSDSISNQGELDVDCGGPCAKVCKVEVSDVVVIWTRIFKIREGFYDVAAYIENPNPFSVYKYVYKFRIYDADNIPVKDVMGIVNLNPHERVLLFDSGVNVGFRIPVRAFLSFPDEPLWQRAVVIEPPNLVISNERLDKTFGIALYATIINNSLEVVNDIELAAFLYDKDGNVVNVSKSRVDTLNKDEQKEIVFTWPEESSIDIVTSDIVPRVERQIGNE